MIKVKKIRVPIENYCTVRESTKINGVIYVCIETECVLHEIVEYLKNRSGKIIFIGSNDSIYDIFFKKPYNRSDHPILGKKVLIQNGLLERIDDVIIVDIGNYAYKYRFNFNFNYKSASKALQKNLDGVGLMIFDYDQHYFGVTRRMKKKKERI